MLTSIGLHVLNFYFNFVTNYICDSNYIVCTVHYIYLTALGTCIIAIERIVNSSFDGLKIGKKILLIM